ncbi:MAG: hypothetical protein AB1649_07980 [Chloroflexota bacterium]
MQKQNFFLRPAFYVITVVYIVLGYLTLAMGDQVASVGLSEDHYFENLGAIGLFVASGFSFWAFLRARKLPASGGMSTIKQLVYLGLALVFFFLAAEEISWGQRIFNLATPQALEQQNDQGEINIHNLTALENSGLFRPDRMFDVFWAVFVVAIPAVSMLGGRFQNVATRFVPVVHWGLGSLFVFNYLLAKVAKAVLSASYTYGRVVPFTQAVQEVKESNYELLFAFVALYLLLDLKRLEGDESKS